MATRGKLVDIDSANGRDGYCRLKKAQTMLHFPTPCFQFAHRLRPERFGLLLSLFSLLALEPACPAAVRSAGGVGVYDLRQDKRSVLRNYPVIGHIRFMLSLCVRDTPVFH